MKSPAKFILTFIFLFIIASFTKKCSEGYWDNYFANKYHKVAAKGSIEQPKKDLVNDSTTKNLIKDTQLKIPPLNKIPEIKFELLSYTWPKEAIEYQKIDYLATYKYEKFYPQNNALRVLGHIEYGTFEGSVKWYYESGSINVIGHYNNGIKTGVWKMYRDDIKNSKIFEESFINRKETQIWYDENGVISHEKRSSTYDEKTEKDLNKSKYAKESASTSKKYIEGQHSYRESLQAFMKSTDAMSSNCSYDEFISADDLDAANDIDYANAFVDVYNYCEDMPSDWGNVSPTRKMIQKKSSVEKINSTFYVAHNYKFSNLFNVSEIANIKEISPKMKDAAWSEIYRGNPYYIHPNHKIGLMFIYFDSDDKIINTISFHPNDFVRGYYLE